MTELTHDELVSLSRDDLNAEAKADGVADPESYANKAALADAILHLDRDGNTVTDDGERLPYYCPGCGRQWAYPGECTGRNAETPHPPIQTVDSAELDGDPENHTPAPNTGTT